MNINQAMEDITGIGRKKLIGSDFYDYFTEPQKALKIYQEVFAGAQKQIEEISDLLFQLETTLNQACSELRVELTGSKNYIMNKNKTKLFLVDDDAVFLKLLEIQFMEQADYDIETFAAGELCIDGLSRHPDVIILDYHLDGVDPDAINGIDTLDNINAFNPDIPVIMLSSQDKIDVAINCMHHKATDYVVKSETAFLRLKKIITTILATQKLEEQLTWYMDRM